MNILKNRYVFLLISGVFFLISLFLIFVPKLNLGIDMTGGTQAEYSFVKPIDVEAIRLELQEIGEKVIFDDLKVINSVTSYTVSGENTLVVISGFDNTILDKDLDVLKHDFRENVLNLLQENDSEVIEINYTNIGKSFGDYIKNTAFTTLIIAIIGIALYVTYAFSGVVTGISIMSFSLITVITLFHDIILSTGAYIVTSLYFPEFKIDTFFITALLTILGYSINDTIVVFDRIRHNLKLFGGRPGKYGKNLEEIVNLSIGETLKRSIYTSLTLFFVLFAIFFFGPEAIRGFILVMIFGTIFGTYSSIFIASPILFEVNRSKVLEVYRKKIIKQEDKIVV